MNRSAARLAFPVRVVAEYAIKDAELTLIRSQTFTGEHVTELIKKLVEVDSDWVPTDPGTSLCTSRPFQRM